MPPWLRGDQDGSPKLATIAGTQRSYIPGTTNHPGAPAGPAHLLLLAVCPASTRAPIPFTATGISVPRFPGGQGVVVGGEELEGSVHPLECFADMNSSICIMCLGDADGPAGGPDHRAIRRSGPGSRGRPVINIGRRRPRCSAQGTG